MNCRTRIALLLGSLLACQAANADVIMHAFNWKYADVTAKASDIAAAGYKVVLISPPLKSSGSEWWARYQPQDYRVIDTPLGNKQTHENHDRYPLGQRDPGVCRCGAQPYGQRELEA